MSATLGDMTTIMKQIEDRTGREAVHVTSAERPVPLDFTYRETPIHETVDWLAETKRAPIYLVNFTQRECAEIAQGLTSMPLTTKEEKKGGPRQPRADYLFAVFEHFRSNHPWVGGDMIKPKSIGREMIEDYLDFGDYVKKYGLHRFEGVLLRNLSQLYKTLDQNVPDFVKDDYVLDVVGYFRSMLERVDTSLIEEREGLRHPELRLEEGVEDSHEAHRLLAIEELRADERKLGSRVRAEMRQLVRTLSQRDWEAAENSVRQPEDEVDRWPTERFLGAMAPFYEAFDKLVFDHRARLKDTTVITREGDKRWRITQNLFDPEDENLWYIEGEVDLDHRQGGPLVAITEIGS